MRKQPAVVVAAFAVLLALAGCVGVPSGGGVQVGPMIDDPDNPGVEFVVLGPTPDATPDEILAGFMQAVRAPLAALSLSSADQFVSVGPS